LSIILPIGLSFHTFQAMSYTIEIYRGHQKAERHFGIYSLYVMFYPQLVAGPIERPQNLLHQFHEKHFLSFEEIKSGIIQVSFGLFKKVVIADRLAIAVDYSYRNYRSQSGLSLAIAAVFYSFQIYCDFSGYSDIAIGTARIMGFKLMTNFNAPYFAKSVSEFWKRWHISLSTWFRDYLYISLGGNRVGKFRVYLNLFLVFLVSGLWHGANWTFVIWGALHGVFAVTEKALSVFKGKIKINWDSTVVHLSQMAITFLLVTMAWVFFRAETYIKAITILNKILHASVSDVVALKLNKAELVFSLVLIILLIIKDSKKIKISVRNNYAFVIIISLISVTCYFFGLFGNNQFIYFQF